MRILSGHLTPLDRQTTESINIVEAEKSPEQALNRKTEWGGAKIPGILVTQPKGVAKQTKNATNIEDNKAEFEVKIESNNKNRRGFKRMKYKGDDSGANEAFLEAAEDDGAGQVRQDEQEQQDVTKRCRRISPAPNMTKRSPKTSASPKPPKPTSGTKRNARGDSKVLQTVGAESEDPPS